ncbi:12163_t:CDS:2 [Funneliformis geosporum]|uniref:16347_t:CDS:1 n=1 Tax=Funneliformis geosporum TaxID=1117311 RepID=A0A9W4SZG9_9GLOM|nr:12163_t:CDS:2 [Funneliformis geosporum]CAI2189196.1 16347_t:CDS:2 [Funneliformis geosporum]
MSTFDLETDDQIRNFMQGEGKYHSSPYMEMSNGEKFNKFRAVNKIQGMWLTHRRHFERGIKKPKISGTNTIIDLYHRSNNNTIIVFNPSYTTTFVFSNVPLLRPRPRLPDSENDAFVLNPSGFITIR